MLPPLSFYFYFQFLMSSMALLYFLSLASLGSFLMATLGCFISSPVGATLYMTRINTLLVLITHSKISMMYQAECLCQCSRMQYNNEARHQVM